LRRYCWGDPRVRTVVTGFPLFQLRREARGDEKCRDIRWSYKASVLKQMMPPQNRSVAELSRETGITETTLYTWRNAAGKSGAVMPGGGRNKADAWDSASKFAGVW